MNDRSCFILGLPPYPLSIIASGGIGGWGVDVVHFMGVADEVVFLPLCLLLGVASGVMYALGTRCVGGAAMKPI